MFNPSDLHLPFRSKSACNKGPPLRGQGRRTNPSSYGDFEEMVTSPLAARDLWEQQLFHNHGASTRRYQDLDGFPPVPDYFAEDYGYRSPRATTPRDTYPERRVPFEKAAAAMYTALEQAAKECQIIEKSFNEQIRGLSHWLPPQYIDSLWALRLEWDGVAANQPPKDHLKPEPRSNAIFTYPKIKDRFAKALQAMKDSAPPEKLGLGSDPTGSRYRSGGYGGQQASYDPAWDGLRTTMRKLQISLEAVEEMLESVKQRREKMGGLVRELVAAVQLLESVREIWDQSKKPFEKPTPAATASPSSTKGRNDYDYEWPDCREI